MAGGRDARLVLILVHGTWGRGVCPQTRMDRDPQRRAWVEPGSPFCRRLAEGLAAEGLRFRFTRVLWTGSNSFRAREAAARRLATRLRRIDAVDPDARKVVVAHSHGGNVALLALERLGEPVPGTGLVTMATPFIRLDRRPLRASTRACLVVLVLACALWAVRFAGGFGWPWYGELALTFFALCGALAPLIVLAALWRRGGRLRERTAGGSVPVPALCLRGFADEATLSLGLGNVASELARLLVDGPGAAARCLEPVRRRLRACSRSASRPVARRLLRTGTSRVAFYASILVALFVVAGLLSAAGVIGSIGQWGPRVLLAVLALFYGGVALAGLGLGFLGRELLYAGFPLIASVESTPDAHDVLSVETLGAARDAPRSLRHALYEHPEVVECMLRWLAGPAAGPPPDRRSGTVEAG